MQIDTFDVVLRNDNSSLSGVDLAWSSSDPNILSVLPVDSTAGTIGTVSGSKLRAIVIGRSAGSVVLAVTVTHPGFTPVTLRDTISVQPPSAHVSWPPTLSVNDSATVSISFVDARGNGLSSGTAEWRTTDPTMLSLRQQLVNVAGATPADSLKALLTATLMAVRRGTDSIEVTVDRAGFAPITVRGSVSVTERWIDVGTGYGQNCAVSFAHDAYCWGPWFGYLGNGTLQSAIPAAVLGLSGFKFASISVGPSDVCGAMLEGVTFCWGENAYGALGNGTTLSQHIPVYVNGSSYSFVTVGADFTCGIVGPPNLQAGSVDCWGVNNYNQLALLPIGPNVTAPARAAYTAFESVLQASTLSGGGSHTCAIDMNAQAYCWGQDGFGETGQGTMPSQLCQSSAFGIIAPCTPFALPVTGGLKFFTVSASTGDRGSSFGGYSCGVTTANDVYCWGINNTGQLGTGAAGPEQCVTRLDFPQLGTTPCSTTPRRIAGNLKFVSVATAVTHACGVTTTGQGYCWGGNSEGELGTGDFSASSVPRPVAGNHTFLKISVAGGSQGYAHSCGITTPDGALYCWGNATHLGSVTAVNSPIPVRVAEPAPRN